MTNLRPANRGSPSVTRRYATTATRVFVAVTALTAPGGFTAMAAGPWPSIDRPPPRVGGGSEDAALVVAIEDYAVLPDIPGAEDNGRAWRSWFVETRALKPSRVQVLLGSEGTPAQIAAQAKRLAASVGPRGRFWFVFIGHGAPAEQGGDGVLVGPFAQQNAIDFYSQSLPTRDIEGLIVAAGASGIMVIDACFSGRTRGGAALVPGLQPVLLAARERTSKSIHFLSAGANDEFAGPLPGADRPAFSYLVLGALQGWADAPPYGNADRKVTLGEVLEFSRGALAATLRGRNQTPQLVGDDALAVSRVAEVAPLNLGRIQDATIAQKPGHARPSTPSDRGSGTTNDERPLQEPRRSSRTIAVVGLDPQGLSPEHKWLGSSFSDAITTHVAGMDADVRIVERAALDLIMNELKVSQSEAFDPRRSARLGRLIGADTVLVGSLAQLGGRLVARGRLVDVETGEVRKGFEAAGLPSELLALQHTFAQRLLVALGLTPGVTGTVLGEEIPLDLHARLAELRALVASIPAYGLDPARRRRRAELELGRSNARAILGVAPNHPEALAALGRISLQLDDVATAESCAESLQARHAGNLAGHLLRVALHAWRRDRTSAVDAALDATRHAPHEPQAWYVLGQAAAAAGDLALATQAYLRAMENGAQGRAPETGLAVVLAGQQGARVSTELRATDWSSALAAEAYAQLRKGPTGIPRERIDDLVRARPRLWIGWLARARIHKEQGRVSSAYEDLRTAVTLAPSAPELHREMALVSAEVGRCDAARDHLILYRALETALSDGARIEAAVARCRQVK